MLRIHMAAGVAPYADRVEIVYHDSYNSSATSDMLGILTPAMDAKPDLIFELGFEGAAKAVMVSTATQLGFTGIFGSELWDMPVFIDQGIAADVAGRLYSSPDIDVSEATISPRVHTFYNNYVEKYGIAQWTPWASNAYASMATREVGWKLADSVDPEKVMLPKLLSIQSSARRNGVARISSAPTITCSPRRPSTKTDAEGKVVADTKLDSFAWWQKNGDKALPVLKAGGQVAK